MGFSVHQHSDGKIFKTKVLMGHCCTICRFWIETLMKEVKPVLTDKNEFHYRNKLILIAFFATFIILNFWCKEHKNNLSIVCFAIIWKLWIETLLLEIKFVVNEKWEFEESRDNSIVLALAGKFDWYYSDTNIKKPIVQTNSPLKE